MVDPNILFSLSVFKARAYIPSLTVSIYISSSDDSLIHLDPHYSQSAVDMTRTDFDVSVSDKSSGGGRGCFILLLPFFLQSYHCRSPKKINVSKMDPSCTLGFYCHTLEDFKHFRSEAEKVRGIRTFTHFPPPSLSSGTSSSHAERSVSILHFL